MVKKVILLFAFLFLFNSPLCAEMTYRQPEVETDPIVGAVTGIVKADGAGNISAATAGTDYYNPGGTDVAIADGGTGQGTAQAAINALTAVSGATDEHVLTKDTATGNVIFKISGAGTGDLKADGSVPLTADWNAGNSLYDITAVEFKGALVGNADTVTNGVYTTDFPLNQDTTGKATTAGNADTVTNGVYTSDFPLNQDTTGSSASCTGNAATATNIADNTGTTTTVLHGNAAGTPSFSAVVTNDITNSNVTYAKIQNVSATDKILGRSTAGAGVIEE